MTTTHDCPAPGCDAQVPFEMLACRTHWYQIPSDLRRELWFEYRRHFGEDSYFEARAECLAALGVPDEEIAGANAGVARR